MNIKSKLLRITTVPISLKTLLKGQQRFMSEKGFEVLGVSSAGAELDEVQEYEGIAVAAIEMTRTIAPLKDLKALWQFYRLCKKEQPLLVHSHTPKAGIIGMLGGLLAGVPLRLHTVAGMPLMEVTGIQRKILDAVEKLTYACATKVYPNSAGLYDFILQNQYAQKSKLKVIANGSSNGIDTAFFDPAQISTDQIAGLKSQLGIGSHDFVFVFVGRLVGDKGINELVAAFQRLVSRSGVVGKKQVKLLLVGPLEPELDPLATETLQLIENHPDILAVGFQKDVRPYLAIGDALVFPSYREGFPNVVMQAGAMGLPCIVSDINGCNEIIIEGQNGLLIPSKDIDALLQKMLLLVTEEALSVRLAANARPMIVTRYEQKVVWEAILEEYHLLMMGLEIRD